MTPTDATRPWAVIPALSGTFAGFLIGWLIAQSGVSNSARPLQTPSAEAATAKMADSTTATKTTPPPLDTARQQAMEQAARDAPRNVDVRIALGNLLMDAERYDQAVPWYEAALALDAKNVEVSTDLAVCYYSTDQVERALAQFDKSLALDPRHTKTLLNQGIVRAFGKQDLAGATESWNRLLALAPTSPEGQRARQMLDGLTTAHAGTGAGRSGR